MTAGVTTPNLTPTALADSVLVNRGGNTMAQPIAALTRQLASDLSISQDRAAAVQAAADAAGARDAATVNAEVYLSVETGLLSTPADGQFVVVSGQEIRRYRNDAGHAVLLARHLGAEALQSSTALAGHYISARDSLAYPFLGNVFGVSDKGAWFDVALPGDASTDLAGRIAASDGAAVARLRLHQPGALQEVDQLAGINVVGSPNWAASGATFATVAGPDGGSVTLVRENSKSTHHYAVTGAIATVQGRVYTTVALLKAQGRTKIRLAFGNDVIADFDLSAGEVIAASANTEARISEYKNGFWRCEMSFVAGATMETCGVYLLSAAGTTPYVGDGTSGVAVAWIARLYSSQDDFAQGIADRRPLLVVSDNGTRCLRGDGVNDQMRAALVDLAGAEQVTIAIAARQRTHGTTAQILIEHGGGLTFAGFAHAQNNGAPSGNRSVSASTTGPASRTVHVTGSSEVDENYALVAVIDPSRPNKGDQIEMYINGARVVSSSVAPVGTLTDDAFQVLSLFLLARAGASPVLPSDADIYAGLIIGRRLSSAEIASVSRTLRDRAGIPQPSSGGGGGDEGGVMAVSPVAFSEAGPVVVAGAVRKTNAFAAVELTTEATELIVDSWNDLYGSHPSLTRLGIYVDGVYNQSVTPAGTGTRQNTISLPAGPKLVSIVNGPQSRPSGDPKGCWVTRIEGNEPIQQVIRPASRVLVYGDSISVGDAASPVMQDAWVMRLRAALHPLSVALEGWGYRSLHEDCQTEEQRKAFVRRVMAYNPQTLWLAIGTNDYGLNRWAAAAFGAAYADLLDRLHAAMPALRIYAQTPLVRATETANGSGSTMGDYRTQITTALSSRSWATLIDGTAILTTGDLGDGVHPTTAGHGIYATHVRGVLGW